VVEFLPSKQAVAGSNPVSRSTEFPRLACPDGDFCVFRETQPTPANTRSAKSSGVNRGSKFGYLTIAGYAEAENLEFFTPSPVAELCA
jgi:hypothetical protein